MNLICGINPVLEALNAGTRHFDRLLVVKGLRNQRISEAMARAGQMGVPLRFEARETLDRMAAGTPHQGVIAVVSPKPVMPVDELLASAREPALVMILDGVEDPRNLGAILRSAEAAGADGVLLPDRHNAGLSETVARSSAGALEHVKIARIGNVAQAIETLKSRGFWIVGLDADGRERWDSVDYKRPVALVMGGEGKGIRRLVKERCDHIVSVPLFGHVSSLNVSVAAGIALYEVVRQRGVVPSHVKPIPPRVRAHVEGTIGPGPDDGEHDPGHEPHAHEDRHRDLHDDEADLPEDDQSVTFAAIHEEAAWAGPTMMKDAGGSRRTHREGRRGPHGHRRPSPQAPADKAQGGEPTAEGGPPRRGGRRRRRRGRPGPPGAGPAVGDPAAPRDSPPGGTSSPAADTAEQGRGGSRRRRRRRHRPPMV